jgi:Ca2+-binding RTX toxin-like protein
MEIKTVRNRSIYRSETDLQTLKQRAFAGRASAHVEPLESRRLLSAYIENRVLFVDGTAGNDTVITNGGFPPEVPLEITLNGETRSFDTADFDRIHMRGFAGHDTFDADTDPPVLVEGGDGNDRVDGHAESGLPTVVGGNGNDVVRWEASGQLRQSDLRPFDGGAGRDKIIYGSFIGDLDLRGFPTVEDATIEFGKLVGNSLNNSLQITNYGDISGGDGNDTLDGSLMDDADFSLLGENGNDRLIGVNSVHPASTSVSNLDGGAGNDTLVSGVAPETLKGGSGLDTLDYSSRTGNLGITIDNVANDGARGASGPPTEGDNAMTDIETVFAGSGNDYIFGNGLNNLFRGNAGNDFLGGFGGNDALYGGSGHDRLEGGNGNDYLEGNSGNDALLGESGTDYFVAGDGDDWLYSRDGIREHVDGGNGFDRAQRDSIDSVLSIESFLA